jgi:hypothetical protein
MEVGEARRTVRGEQQGPIMRGGGGGYAPSYDRGSGLRGHGGCSG